MAERLGACGEPPGSRVATPRCRPLAVRATSCRVWVDLPAPSPPSSVTKRPRRGALPASLEVSACGLFRLAALSFNRSLRRMRVLHGFHLAEEIDAEFEAGIHGPARDRADGNVGSRHERGVEQLRPSLRKASNGRPRRRP